MGFMDNVMGSFNDEAGKINTGTGQYRVMQVVLREKFVGKGSKNFAEIEELCNQQYAEVPPSHVRAVDGRIHRHRRRRSNRVQPRVRAHELAQRVG